MQMDHKNDMFEFMLDEPDDNVKDTIFDSSLFLYSCNENNNDYRNFVYFDSPDDEIHNMQGVSMST